LTGSLSGAVFQKSGLALSLGAIAAGGGDRSQGGADARCKPSRRAVAKCGLYTSRRAPMASQWYYAKYGVQHGPVSSRESKELADGGELVPTDLVWKEGLPKWHPASKVKGLFPVAPPKPVPVPVAPVQPDEQETETKPTPGNRAITIGTAALVAWGLAW